MACVDLTLDTLGELDNGSARLIIEAALRDATRDLDDRGKDGKERTVNIVVRMHATDSGLAVVRVEAHPKLPPRKTGVTVGDIRFEEGKSKVRFQTYDPKDPRQRTLDEAGGEVPNH